MSESIKSVKMIFTSEDGTETIKTGTLAIGALLCSNKDDPEVPENADCSAGFAMGTATLPQCMSVVAAAMNTMLDGYAERFSPEAILAETMGEFVDEKTLASWIVICTAAIDIKLKMKLMGQEGLGNFDSCVEFKRIIDGGVDIPKRIANVVEQHAKAVQADEFYKMFDRLSKLPGSADFAKAIEHLIG